MLEGADGGGLRCAATQQKCGVFTQFLLQISTPLSRTERDGEGRRRDVAGNCGRKEAKGRTNCRRIV